MNRNDCPLRLAMRRVNPAHDGMIGNNDKRDTTNDLWDYFDFWFTVPALCHLSYSGLTNSLSSRDSPLRHPYDNPIRVNPKAAAFAKMIVMRPTSRVACRAFVSGRMLVGLRWHTEEAVVFLVFFTLDPRLGRTKRLGKGIWRYTWRSVLLTTISGLLHHPNSN